MKMSLTLSVCSQRVLLAPTPETEMTNSPNDLSASSMTEIRPELSFNIIMRLCAQGLFYTRKLLSKYTVFKYAAINVRSLIQFDEDKLKDIFNLTPSKFISLPSSRDSCTSQAQILWLIKGQKNDRNSLDSKRICEKDYMQPGSTHFVLNGQWIWVLPTSSQVIQAGKQQALEFSAQARKVIFNIKVSTSSPLQLIQIQRFFFFVLFFGFPYIYPGKFGT